MTVEPIADLRAVAERAVAELAFAAGLLATTEPERAEHLLTAASAMEETLQRTASARP